MRIILLRGPSHSGKTTIIKNLYEKLRENDEKNSFYYKHIGLEKDKDFEAVATYKGMKVAFFSAGAHKGLCLSNIIRFAWADILVLAENDKFEPILDDYNTRFSESENFSPLPHVCIKCPDAYCKKKILDALDEVVASK